MNISTYSQAGQDFWVIGEVFNERSTGYFVDIGAHDGVYLSNTYLLEKQYGWSGLAIEANPRTFEKLQANRKAICVNTCLDCKEQTVKFALRDVYGGIVDRELDNKEIDGETKSIELQTRTLASVFAECSTPSFVDYMSIDIEGAEERVLKDFPFDKYEFGAITIERPSRALRNVLLHSGYMLVKEIPGLDCFYINQKIQKHYRRNCLSFYDRMR